MAVLRTEVMPPLRDTVCLIHRIERNLHVLQKVHILVLLQALRRQVQQFRPPFRNILLHLMYLRTRQRRVDIMRHPGHIRVVAHHIHLILHQGDKRRDNNPHAVHHQRRQLKTQALAPARRHQHKRVLPLHHVADNGFLIPFERIKAEIALQRLYQFFMRY